MDSLINFYKMNDRYIYHPEQDTGITRISEVSLLPGPNHCFPLKRISFISSITTNWFYLLLILI